MLEYILDAGRRGPHCFATQFWRSFFGPWHADGLSSALGASHPGSSPARRALP